VHGHLEQRVCSPANVVQVPGDLIRVAVGKLDGEKQLIHLDATVAMFVTLIVALTISLIAVSRLGVHSDGYRDPSEGEEKTE